MTQTKKTFLMLVGPLILLGFTVYLYRGYRDGWISTRHRLILRDEEPETFLTTFLLQGILCALGWIAMVLCLRDSLGV